MYTVISLVLFVVVCFIACITPSPKEDTPEKLQEERVNPNKGSKRQVVKSYVRVVS